MTQYIVFKNTEEAKTLISSNLRKYYETSIIGYYIGEKGRKKQSIKAVAAILDVPELDINLVPMVVNGSDLPSAIARIKGDITTKAGKL